MITQKQLAQINLTDDVISRVQTNVGNALDPVLATPILDGVLVTGLTIPSTLKLAVSHKLGRKPNGAIVVLASAPLSTYCALFADQVNPSGSLVLTFTSGAGAVVNVWVF